MSILYISGVSFLAIFLWEHLARTNGITFRPAVGLGHVGKFLQARFEQIGVWIAKVVVMFHFAEMIISLYELFESVWKILVSPSHVVIAYLRYYYEHTSFTHVQIGTNVMVLLVATTAYFFFDNAKKFLDDGGVQVSAIPVWAGFNIALWACCSGNNEQPSNPEQVDQGNAAQIAAPVRRVVRRPVRPQESDNGPEILH